MSFKLHLMNDRKILSTEKVHGSDFTTPFRKLMDSLLEDLDNNYVSQQSDTEKRAVNIMKVDAETAKKNPIAREDITSFVTGDPASPQHYYSVVLHATAD